MFLSISQFRIMFIGQFFYLLYYFVINVFFHEFYKKVRTWDPKPIEAQNCFGPLEIEIEEEDRAEDDPVNHKSDKTTESARENVEIRNTKIRKTSRHHPNLQSKKYDHSVQR